jgi:hypothetical protein
MAFKLRYTAEELHQHFRDRLSFWQGQLEEGAHLLKGAKKRMARYERDREMKSSDFSSGYMTHYHVMSEIGRNLGTIAGAECAIARLRLLQSHLPDLAHHDLTFEDLHKLEIRA